LESLILVAVNLSAHYLQDTNLELPLYLLGLDDHAAIDVHDLVSDTHFTLHGKWQPARLDPEQYLYVIWEIKAAGR
jgi:starch synthase (maltosyl-transferring)